MGNKGGRGLSGAWWVLSAHSQFCGTAAAQPMQMLVNAVFEMELYFAAVWG